MILFVDDEPRYSVSYIDFLETAHRVEYKSKVSDALEFLEARRGDVELLVLDVMMPPGDAFSEEEARDGLDTGKRLFERVREGNPDLPVVVLTNVTQVDIANWFEKQPNCWFYRKRECLPGELKQKVEEILSK